MGYGVLYKGVVDRVWARAGGRGRDGGEWNRALAGVRRGEKFFWILVGVCGGEGAFVRADEARDGWGVCVARRGVLRRKRVARRSRGASWGDGGVAGMSRLWLNGTMLRVVAVEDAEAGALDVFRDVRDKDLRGRGDVFMAESELVVRRLLRQPDRIVSLLVSPERLEAMRSALAVLGDDVPVYVGDVAAMTEIAGFHIHRGVLAAGRRPPWWEVTLGSALADAKKKRSAVILAAEGMTNVDNMGGMFRNAAAFGVDGVVLDPTCCDPLYRKAIRVSMGHTLSVPWAISRDWPGDVRLLKQPPGEMGSGGWDCYVAAMESGGDAQPLWRLKEAWEISGKPNLCLVFGSEGHGLSKGVLDAADGVFEVPMTAGVPSLNVAVAVGVALYEVRRG